ncbi:MAG TPA: response regulator [Segetibacter sp.]|jgi:CheY-like chemotaxis protein
MPKFKSVLLVEDDPITVMVCDRIIKMNGFSDEVKSCENGRYALEYLKEKATVGTYWPDIIFLDINMPVMNGWDFLEELEQIKDTLPPLPRIFILSSTVDPEDFSRAKSFSTVEDFISKPLEKDYLDTISASASK